MQAIFIAIGRDHNTINFWIIRKGGEVVFRQAKVESGTKPNDPITCLLKTTFKVIGAGVSIRCKNRSFDEITGNSPSNSASDEKLTESSHGSIIGPIADLFQGDELIIFPDGPLCLRLHCLP